jgi:adenylylsulfate kinase
MIVDGDIVRQFLGSSKDFSPVGRREHQNRLRGRLNQMTLMDRYNLVVASITPYEDMRRLNRAVFKENYFEVLLDCGLLTLMKRDPKGLYARACQGEIPYFTGITDTFERGTPDLIVDTNGIGEEESYRLLLEGVNKWLQC